MKDKYQGPGTVKVVKDNMNFKLKFDELEVELDSSKKPLKPAPSYDELMRKQNDQV